MNPTFFSLRLFPYRGQSLVELLIAVGIGSVMILGAITVIAPAIRGSSQVAQSQTAGAGAAELMDNVRGWSETDWHNIYNLAKTSSSPYYLIAGTSTITAATGTETVPSDGVTSGLVGWWRFDEATGTTVFDYSGNNTKGSWSGTATGTSGYYSAGRAGWAGTFDGASDYANFGTSPNLNFGTSDFSVVIWIKTTQAGFGRVFNKRIGGDTSWYSLILNYPTSNCFTLETASGVGTCDTVVINDGRYHSIAAIKSGTVISYYVDGNAAGTSAAASNIASVTSMIVGQWNSSQYFQGLIDDVRAYNRALSQTEVQNIYTGGFYSRYFYVENVKRNASGFIDPAGAIDDPSSQKVTVVYSWPSLTTARSFVSYLTRYSNRTAIQTDWTGAGGQSTSSRNFGNTFASSTNIDFTTSTGSINIQGY